jgi:hypothetical protein
LESIAKVTEGVSDFARSDILYSMLSEKGGAA